MSVHKWKPIDSKRWGKLENGLEDDVSQDFQNYESKELDEYSTEQQRMENSFLEVENSRSRVLELVEEMYTISWTLLRQHIAIVTSSILQFLIPHA